MLPRIQSIAVHDDRLDVVVVWPDRSIKPARLVLCPCNVPLRVGDLLGMIRQQQLHWIPAALEDPALGWAPLKVQVQLHRQARLASRWLRLRSEVQS
jgi:hypothetical protein